MKILYIIEKCNLYIHWNSIIICNICDVPNVRDSSNDLVICPQVSEWSIIFCKLVLFTNVIKLLLKVSFIFQSSDQHSIKKKKFCIKHNTMIFYKNLHNACFNISYLRNSIKSNCIVINSSIICNKRNILMEKNRITGQREDDVVRSPYPHSTKFSI